MSKRERFIFSAPARLATFSSLLSLSMHPFLLSLDAEADADVDLNRAAVIEREKASDDDDEDEDVVIVNVTSPPHYSASQSSNYASTVRRSFVALNGAGAYILTVVRGHFKTLPGSPFQLTMVSSYT